MRNYAEELTYWYLRLNGFFLLTDFVLHRRRPEYSGDCDILAVRPPNVHEDVGGRWNDWDKNMRQFFSPTVTVGVICEVKAGNFTPANLFSQNNVEYAFKRLGFIPAIDVPPVVEAFQNSKCHDIGTYKIIKLLVSNRTVNDDTNFYCLTLSYIRGFIKKRMKKFPIKDSDWTFFQSSIIQEIIWEAHRKK
jgi:hypothetical protein